MLGGIRKFKPQYAGKMNFYLSAVDDKLKTEKDHPSIGIIICKEKSKVMAEYALRDRNKPMGIIEYKITESLPEEINSRQLKRSPRFQLWIFSCW